MTPIKKKKPYDLVFEGRFSGNLRKRRKTSRNALKHVYMSYDDLFDNFFFFGPKKITHIRGQNG